MASTNPFLKRHRMPDGTMRRPLFDRVPSERVARGAWRLTEDVDSPAYWESTPLTIAACLTWMARNIQGGVRIEKGQSGWTVGNAAFTVSVTEPTLAKAVLRAAHTIADRKGVPR